MKVYISGKVTGCPDFRKKFADAERRLRALGHKPINPVKWEKSGKEWSWYLRKDLRKLTRCDAICLLDDHNDSEGAKLELFVARKLGMAVFHLNKMFGFFRER